ncbi:MAG: 2-aminoethylphosphonate aminotransferase [Pseudomonadota bacterium]
MILMNPGPIVLSERVRQSLLKPDLCHREEEFVALQNKIRTELLAVYNLNDTDWASILLTGSGTSAMEAMMTSFVPAHGKLLIIENGVYGERITKIAKIYNIDHIIVHHDWGEALDLKRIEGELNYEEGISHVAVVHHETTSGRLNNIDAVSDLCKKYGNPALLLDAVSSFGAESIKFNEWNIAACAATANKCLHGVPGTSFVIGNRSAIEMMSATPARSLYLNLVTYLNTQDNNATPYTQSVQTFYALAEALDELSDSGNWQIRNKLYWKRMDRVRNGLIDIGIKPFLNKEECSCVLNAFYIPDGMTYDLLHDRLKESGFVIYAAQGGFSKSMFRISCMGEMADDDLERFIDVMKEIVST